MSELVDLRARHVATEAARRARRVAHRLTLAEVAYVPPTAAEMDRAHQQIHDHPRGLCPRCGDVQQLSMF